MALKIQVLGKGLIPRGYGLAPRKEPFKADLSLIQLILATPGLKVNMIHPVDGHAVEITKANLKRTWDSYSNYDSAKTDTQSVVQQTNPVVPPVQQEEKKEETHQQNNNNQQQNNQNNKNQQYNNNKHQNKNQQNNNNQQQNNNGELKPVNGSDNK